MGEIAKSSKDLTPATTVPSHNHIISGDIYAGEDIAGLDACYITSTGLVLRSLESQVNAAGGINDVQTVTFSSNTNGGNAPWSYLGVGVNIPYNASAATIQTALRALSTVNGANVTVTGAFPTYTITAAGAFAALELPVFVVDNVNLQSSDAVPARVSVVHTTVGQPAGDGTEKASSKVRGFAPKRYKKGEVMSLYDAFIAGISDGNLTSGADLYLSGTVPGGLSDTPTLTGQQPLGFAIDTVRAYFFARN